MKSLIEQLYTPKAVSLIRDLYKDDSNSRESFYEAFGNKILEKQSEFLPQKPLDILMLICATAKFASSLHESQNVAVIIHRRITEANPLPYILDDRGLDLAEKTFVSLAFFYPAMEKRWKKGGPHPDFYKQYSKRLFETNNLEDLAHHYEKWLNFLTEIFV
jgi:hypothetical protein